MPGAASCRAFWSQLYRREALRACMRQRGRMLRLQERDQLLADVAVQVECVRGRARTRQRAQLDRAFSCCRSPAAWRLDRPTAWTIAPGMNSRIVDRRGVSALCRIVFTALVVDPAWRDLGRLIVICALAVHRIIIFMFDRAFGERHPFLRTLVRQSKGRSPWRWWRSNRGAPPRHAAKTVRIGARARHATGPAAWTSCIDGGMNAPPSRIPLASR